MQATNHFKTAVIFGLYTHFTGHAFYGFYIMRDYLRGNINYILQVIPYPSEIRNQGFQCSIRI
ncbi:hypothetical protein D3C80_1658120 [compost metagenome]